MNKEKSQFMEIVRDVQGKYPRILEQPENSFFRSYNEIVRSSGIHYLCCTERTHALAHELAQEGFSPTEILIDIKRRYHRRKMGSAMEITLDRTNYKFASINSGDVLVPGRYEEKGKFNKIIRAEIGTNGEFSWFDYFGIKDSNQLKEALNGFDMDRFTRKLSRKSSEKDYQKHLKKIQENKAKPDSIF